MSSKIDVAALLALGLTARLFPGPRTLSDVRLLAHGRMHLWPGWEGLDVDSYEAVARFLRCRPDDLAEDGPLLDRLRQILRAADDFEVAQDNDGAEPTWGSDYRAVAGADLGDRIGEWFDQLQKLDARSSGTPAPVGGEGGDLVLHSGGQAFRVPAAHVPEVRASSLALTTSPEARSLVLDRNELAELARLMDGAPQGEKGLYEKVAIGQFLDSFVASGGSPARTLEAGVTRLAVAPTGAGKSVFARLVALDLARRGHPVALVVPDIQAVWKEVLRLRDGAVRAGIEVQITPLSSWRNLAVHLANHLVNPPAEDRDGRWALRSVAYACHLSAYAEGAGRSVEPGQEPCTRLRQADPRGGKERRVACPFSHQCGRFAAFEAAPTADILVVNHHAFLAGRIPVEVSVDGAAPRKLSTAELVLRRCGAVFIDEIDALQNSAIGSDSRGLVLSSRGRLSKPSRLYSEVEQRRAEDRLDRGLRFERGRSALLRIMHEAERLSELINRDELEWPERGRMTWREAHDAWIAARLFGEDDDALGQVRALYDKDVIDGNPAAERLRVALAPLGPGLGDGTMMVDVRTRIMEALAGWTLRGRRGGDLQQTRNRLANRLIVRAVLVQLDQALGHLRPQLPGLEQNEVALAAELRDDLLGYAPWQPSPVGALGRRLYGYAFSERLGEQGALETRIMSGDPHGLIREIGGLVAESLAGEARIVVGLSATCRFRGSPRADVLGELAGWVRDEARNVRVRGAGVQARISGIGSRGERMDAARAAAEELWNTMLSRYLDGKLKRADSAGSARALLVTGSYDEARAVAQGLRRSAGQDLPIRYLVSDAAKASSDPDALPRTALESFGKIPAPAVLVGPLSIVARGHNILQPGTHLSALSGIFVLTRPVPPSHDADRFLAHLAYNARMFPPEWQGTPGATVEAERRDAWRRLRALQRSPATFRHMVPELRRELVCDVLVELAQLAGRARRGGTPVDLVFVDGAFQDEIVPWEGLVREVLEWWRNEGWLAEMATLHGAFVAGLADYAGLPLEEP